MSEFVKIGSRYINLVNVDLVIMREGGADVFYHDTTHTSFEGNEAQLLIQALEERL